MRNIFCKYITFHLICQETTPFFQRENTKNAHTRQLQPRLSTLYVIYNSMPHLTDNGIVLPFPIVSRHTHGEDSR